MGPVLKCFLSLFLGTGFSFLAQTGTTLIDSIKDATGYRAYRLYVPSTYTPSEKIPLVLNFHGLGLNAMQQEVYADFRSIADTGYFLVLHPEGNKSSSGQFWNAGLLTSPDDLQYVNRLLDSIEALYTIDTDRVYACGLSNGGILSYFLACNLSGRIAAIASVAGTMFGTWFRTCKPPIAKPVLVVHGTEDGTVAYEGNGTGALYTDTDSIVEKWREHNHCQSVPSVTQLPDINTNDFSTVTHFVYGQGSDNSSVELFRVNGGSHTWPGAAVSFFHQNMDFNASKEIWRFFSQYRLSQFVTLVGLPEGEDEDQIKIYPNPVAGILTVDGWQAERYCVVSCEGKKVVETSSPDIDVSSLSPGFYVLEIWKNKTCARKKFVRE